MNKFNRVSVYVCLVALGWGVSQAVQGNWKVSAIALGLSATLSSVVNAVALIRGDR